MTKVNEERPKQTVKEEELKDIITKELERAGSGGAFVWAVFFLCVTPNILNGFHVASYTLLGHLPDDQWCGVDDLKVTNWTVDQQRSITQKDLTTNGCTIWDWDYKHLSRMPYEVALNYTSRIAEVNLPTELPCHAKGAYEFLSPESTFVAEWDLVCDRAIQRTSAQVVISLGKFFGSFSFGIFADKFGRKSAFSLGAAFFIVSSFLCTFSPWYSLFLVGRFGLGSASSGLFYPAFTMIVENVCLNHRSWMSIAFSASYPIGMVLLALAAYLVEPWRYLQLTLTVPALLLILNCYLLNESPRWLITKKRYDAAYRILFKKKSHYEIQNSVVETITDKKNSQIYPKDNVAEGLIKNHVVNFLHMFIVFTNILSLVMSSIQPNIRFRFRRKECSDTKLLMKRDRFRDDVKNISLWTKVKEGPMKQFIELFASWKVRKLIFTSYFMFCVTSLSYYVTALNASNLSVSRYLYVAITGIVDLPSYLVPVIMLRYTGRRVTTMSLFFLTGISLLMVLVVPTESTAWIISFAMLGRFGISATYSVVTLYTAELYPTEIRNSALGTCSTWAHVGSISAPYVVDVLGVLGWYIPTTICGCCVLVAGLLTLSLPETGTGKLSDRIEDVPSESDADANAKVKSIENVKK